jgi:hypothetical protein
MMEPACSPGFPDCWSIQLTKKIIHRLSARAGPHGSRATGSFAKAASPAPARAAPVRWHGSVEGRPDTLCRQLWFKQNGPSHYWPLGARRSIADFAIEGLTKFHAHDLEACCNGFDVKIMGTLFRP